MSPEGRRPTILRKVAERATGIIARIPRPGERAAIHQIQAEERLHSGISDIASHGTDKALAAELDGRARQREKKQNGG
jgi:hypothetical protein